MQKIILSLFTSCLLLSCNKDTVDIEVPPFSAYPNPFTNTVFLYVDNQLPPQSIMSLRILNGTEEVVVKFENVAPGNNVAVDMSNQEKGIYYVEMELEGKTYNLPILKAE